MDYPYLYGYARASLELGVQRLEATLVFSREEVADYLKKSLEQLAKLEGRDEEE